LPGFEPKGTCLPLVQKSYPTCSTKVDTQGVSYARFTGYDSLAGTVSPNPRRLSMLIGSLTDTTDGSLPRLIARPSARLPTLAKPAVSSRRTWTKPTRRLTLQRALDSGGTLWPRRTTTRATAGSEGRVVSGKLIGWRLPLGASRLLSGHVATGRISVSLSCRRQTRELITQCPLPCLPPAATTQRSGSWGSHQGRFAKRDTTRTILGFYACILITASGVQGDIRA
jgi:hypothetical protein